MTSLSSPNSPTTTDEPIQQSINHIEHPKQLDNQSTNHQVSDPNSLSLSHCDNQTNSDDLSSLSNRSANLLSRQSGKQSNKRSDKRRSSQQSTQQWSSSHQSQSVHSSVKSEHDDDSSDNVHSDSQYNDTGPPVVDGSANDPSKSSSQSESVIAKKRRHAQIDASRRARETAIIEQLKTLSGQRVEAVKRDRLESLEVAVERYSTLMKELPRLQRLVQRLTLAAQRQGLMDINIDAETWMASIEQTSPNTSSHGRSAANHSSSSQPGTQSSRSSRTSAEFDVVPEEDAEMYLTALSDLIRYRPFHSSFSSTQFISSSAPLCTVRMRDARMMACNAAMLTRLQWRHEPEDIVGLQCVDLWFILADIYRRVATIPFPSLDSNALLIQSTGVVSHTNRTEPIQPLIAHPQHVVNEVIRLLSGLTDVIDVEFLAPAGAAVVQKRRCRVWLTKGWQNMQISNVEMMFHLISITVGPMGPDNASSTSKRPEGS